MSNATSKRLQAIRNALAGRAIAWFGTRGVDAMGLAALGSLQTVVSQIAAIPAVQAEGIAQDCLEERLGERLDLDSYDIDTDARRQAQSLKVQFISRLSGPTVVVAYRSAEFLSPVWFCDPDFVPAFNFHLFQRQFENKPWFELCIRREAPGVKTIPTQFLRVTDGDAIRRACEMGPRVGRTSHGSGGAGVFLFESERDFFERLPSNRDGFVAVSPFLAGSIPLNVNGCVYHDGVAAFGVSYQLIGVQGLTRRRFGFCGNDFAAAAARHQPLVLRARPAPKGRHPSLRRANYRGAFGLDLLVHEGEVLVSELNARFQASTPLSSTINQALGTPDPVTEHVAAFLGMDAPAGLSCIAQTHAAAGLVGVQPVAQVLHRNVLLDPVRLDAAPDVPAPDRIEAQSAPPLLVQSEAILFRSMHARSVTSDGYDVDAAVHTLTERARRGF
jgi:hypothetical protein